MLQNLLLVLVARFTLAFSLQRRRFLRAREFFFSRKRHVETTLPILLCHKIKDGGYNNTNMNKLSPTQNTLALRLPSFRRLISHHIGWLLRGHENHIGWGFCSNNNENGDFSTISMPEESCAALISEVESNISERCSRYSFS